MNELKRSAARGFMWAYASKYSGKLLVFVSTLILARLLIQEDFGVAGYALVVIAFMETLSGLGMKPALIYFKDQPAAKDTAFFLGLLASTALFMLTWFAAPLISEFFRDPRATDVTRMLALTLPISALGNIHHALLEKELKFNRKFVPDFVNSLTKGLASIGFAVSGFGAWSLIYGQIAGTISGVVAVWLVYRWRPSWSFDRQLAKTLLNYGSKIIVVGILGFLVNNVGYFLVGRYLGAALLGVYVLSMRIPDVLIRESALVINRVLFPVFAKVNDDYGTLSRGYLFITRYLSLLVVPLGLGLSAVAEPFVIALLTEKWANAIPVIRLSGVYMLLLALAFGAGTVFKAIGRPGLIIKLSVLRLIILLPLVYWAVVSQASLVSVVWVLVIAVVLHMLISLYLVSRILDFPFRDLIGALWPSFAIGGIMYVGVVLLVDQLHAIHPALQLGAGVVAGAAIYCSLIWCWQREIVLAGYQQLRAAMASRK